MWKSVLTHVTGGQGSLPYIGMPKSLMYLTAALTTSIPSKTLSEHTLKPAQPTFDRLTKKKITALSDSNTKKSKSKKKDNVITVAPTIVREYNYSWDGFCEFINELKTTRKPDERCNLLISNRQFFPLLQTILFKKNRFKIKSQATLRAKESTEINLDKTSPPTLDDLVALLKDLNSQKKTQFSVTRVLSFYRSIPETTQGIFCDVIDKNLKVLVGEATLKKLNISVSSFPVALADTWKYKKQQMDFENDLWYSSRKIDGIRCIARVTSDPTPRVVYYSRVGNQFNTLGKLDKYLLSAVKHVSELDTANNPLDIMLDGELCARNELGEEDFSSSITSVKRADNTIPVTYWLFDTLPWADFMRGTSDILFSERIDKLESLARGLGHPSNANDSRVEVAKQTLIKSQEHLDSLYKEAIDKGWEGLMLRKNIGYKGKRSKAFIKMKPQLDAEFVVEDVKIGPMTVAKGNGTGLEEMVTSLQISYKGNNVYVSSGLSLQQRRDFYADRTKIIGKQITVKYQNITTNSQTGLESLRHPMIKHIYGSSRDV